MGLEMANFRSNDAGIRFLIPVVEIISFTINDYL
jgi:hypothetical protein